MFIERTTCSRRRVSSSYRASSCRLCAFWRRALRPTPRRYSRHFCRSQTHCPNSLLRPACFPLLHRLSSPWKFAEFKNLICLFSIFYYYFLKSFLENFLPWNMSKLFSSGVFPKFFNLECCKFEIGGVREFERTKKLSNLSDSSACRSMNSDIRHVWSRFKNQ